MHPKPGPGPNQARTSATSSTSCATAWSTCRLMTRSCGKSSFARRASTSCLLALTLTLTLTPTLTLTLTLTLILNLSLALPLTRWASTSCLLTLPPPLPLTLTRRASTSCRGCSSSCSRRSRPHRYGGTRARRRRPRWHTVSTCCLLLTAHHPLHHLPLTAHDSRLTSYYSLASAYCYRDL